MKSLEKTTEGRPMKAMTKDVAGRIAMVAAEIKTIRAELGYPVDQQ